MTDQKLSAILKDRALAQLHADSTEDVLKANAILMLALSRLTRHDRITLLCAAASGLLLED